MLMKYPRFLKIMSSLWFLMEIKLMIQMNYSSYDYAAVVVKVDLVVFDAVDVVNVADEVADEDEWGSLCRPHFH